MTTNEIFSKALAKMDNCFTSNEFGKRCTKMGLHHRFIANNSMFLFLIQNCNRGTESKRTWYKKESQDTPPIKQPTKQLEELIFASHDLLNEDVCISFLKNLGYKILKPSFTEL